MTGAFPPLFIQNGGNRGGGAFTSKVFEQAHFGGAFFCPHVPKLAHKSYFCNFAYNFSPTKFIKTFFWIDLRKRSSCVFLQILDAIFLSQATLGAIFGGICRDFAQIFSKSKLLAVRLHTHLEHHCFHNSIVGSFVVIKIVYCSFSGTQKIQNGFL